MGERIVVAGGGTAGHIVPGLALLEVWADQKNEFLWIGSKGSLEEKLTAPLEGVRFQGIPSGKMRRRWTFKIFADLLGVLGGCLASLGIFLRHRPTVVIALGGGTSVPPLVVASLLGIPTLTHESGVDLGLATKINAFFATRILLTYDETKALLGRKKAKKAVVVGNPVRKIMGQGKAEKGRSLIGVPHGQPLLLVLGGSQGAEQINHLLGETLESLTKHCFVVHQMGAAFHKGERRENYLPLSFVGEELTDIMAAADLVVSRAGASTLWELAATSSPAVLIPLTKNTRGDQLRNAEYFRLLGGMQVLIDPTSEHLRETVEDLLADPKKRKTMAQKLNSLKPLEASRRMAKEIDKLIGRRSWA